MSLRIDASAAASSPDGAIRGRRSDWLNFIVSTFGGEGFFCSGSATHPLVVPCDLGGAGGAVVVGGAAGEVGGLIPAATFVFSMVAASCSSSDGGVRGLRGGRLMTVSP